MNRTCSIPLGPEHYEAAARVLERGVLTEGPEVDALEREFAMYLGTSPDCVAAVSSGTTALTAILVEAGITTPDQYVIVPDVTFTATALAVFRAGATPVLADVDETWTLDPESVKSLIWPETAAVIGVDLHGCPADWKALDELCTEWGVLLIEDACAAVGARYRDRPAGLLAGRSAFSLNESKPLAGGEGGLVVAPPATVQRIRAMSRFGELPEMTRDGLRRSTLQGANWKLPELSAAMARASLSTLPLRVSRAIANGNSVRHAITDLSGDRGPLRIHPVPSGAVPAWQKIRVQARTPVDAGAYAGRLRDLGVPIRGGEVARLCEHPALSSCQRARLDRGRLLKSTFCIGSRAESVFAVDPEEAALWTERIRSLPSVTA